MEASRPVSHYTGVEIASYKAPEEEVFRKVLDKYYGGKKDERTLEILKRL